MVTFDEEADERLSEWAREVTADSDASPELRELSAESTKELTERVLEKLLEDAEERGGFVLAVDDDRRVTIVDTEAVAGDDADSAPSDAKRLAGVLGGVRIPTDDEDDDTEVIDF
jgi:hypothetical protein